MTPTTRTTKHPRINDDIEYVTHAEWVRRFGKPGNGGAPDANGRYSGFFATEPCFCEDAPEMFCPIDSAASEQTLEDK